MKSLGRRSTPEFEPGAFVEKLRLTRAGRTVLGATALLLSCGMGAPLNEGTPARDVVVYQRLDFDESAGGFKATNGAHTELTEDAVAGKALLVRPKRGWAGAQLQLAVEGSEGLRLALHAKGMDYPSAELNVFDGLTDDNTTSDSPRFLYPDRWTPVLYSLDHFVYNDRRQTTVEPTTSYESLRFFGPQEPTARSQMIVDNLVLYRGTDSTPPHQVESLTASKVRGGLRLSWRPAQDNVGPMGYAVSRRRGGLDAFVKVAEVHAPGWTDTSPGPGLVEYRVLAFDFERNLGPWSETLRFDSGASDPMGLPESARHAGALDRERLRATHVKGVGRVRKGHICLFGDSLTHARVYRAMGESALGIFTVAAHGFESIRTEHGPRLLDEVLDQENPEYLLVLLGTNNLRGGFVPTEGQLSTWMSDLETVATEARRRGTVVLFGTVPPRGFDDPQSKPEAAYNAALHRLGARIGVPVAPIFERLLAGERRRYLADDGIHWEPAAMKVAAQAWADTVQQVEWILRDR